MPDPITPVPTSPVGNYHKKDTQTGKPDTYLEITKHPEDNTYSYTERDKKGGRVIDSGTLKKKVGHYDYKSDTGTGPEGFIKWENDEWQWQELTPSNAGGHLEPA